MDKGQSEINGVCFHAVTGKRLTAPMARIHGTSSQESVSKSAGCEIASQLGIAREEKAMIQRIGRGSRRAVPGPAALDRTTSLVAATCFPLIPSWMIADPRPPGQWGDKRGLSYLSGPRTGDVQVPRTGGGVVLTSLFRGFRSPGTSADP